MDKRGVKILICCILCTVVVSILFLFAFRISRLTCELVSVEPQRLRHVQLEAFDKKRNKPIRSHDKTMLIKVSGYLEYNIVKSESEADEEAASSTTTSTTTSTSTTSTTTTGRPNWSGGGHLGALNDHHQLSGGQQGHSTVQLNNNSQHPNPSQPQLAFSPQQLNNSSFVRGSGQGQHHPPIQQRAEKRFLPLELESVETRNVASGDGSGQSNGSGSGPDGPSSKHKYILSFNCTKLNMIFVYQGSRVYVESMSLELKPKSNRKSHCELELPKAGAFAVNAAQWNGTRQTSKKEGDLLAHYYCNKPLSYSCRHYSRDGPSSSNGLLLAELHISAIEFETATIGYGRDRKHVKHEFKSKRSECGPAPQAA